VVYIKKKTYFKSRPSNLNRTFDLYMTACNMICPVRMDEWQWWREVLRCDGEGFRYGGDESLRWNEGACGHVSTPTLKLVMELRN